MLETMRTYSETARLWGEALHPAQRLCEINQFLLWRRALKEWARTQAAAGVNENLGEQRDRSWMCCTCAERGAFF